VSRRKRRKRRPAATPPPPSTEPQASPTLPTEAEAGEGGPSPRALEPEPEVDPEPEAEPEPEVEPEPEAEPEREVEPEPEPPPEREVEPEPQAEAETEPARETEVVAAVDWPSPDRPTPVDRSLIASAPAASEAPAPEPPPAPPVTPRSDAYEAAERQAAAEAFSDARESVEIETEPPEAPPMPALALVGADAVAAATRAAIARLPARSTRPETCPFLRTGLASGGLGPPRDIVDHRNLCGALAHPLPVSRPQQELVCLQPSHTSCPRYLRGAMVIQERVAPTPPSTGRSLPVLLATLLVVAIAVAVGTYALLRGGLALPTASPTASPTAPATATPTAAPSATPSPTAAPTATAVAVRPTEPPVGTPLPQAYRSLDPCPSRDPQAPCFLYTIVSGDNLTDIAERYDTTTQVIEDLNPEIDDPDAIEVGDVIRLPPPS
jgi:hypothetical protein